MPSKAESGKRKADRAEQLQAERGVRKWKIRKLQSSICNGQSGFTLVELLVSLVVLLILSMIGFTVVSSMQNSDRVSGAARNTQSLLEGARDRALHDRLPRGIRFMTHPNEADAISRMVYIGPAGKLSEGTVRINSGSGNANINSNRPVITPSNATLWDRLHDRGVLPEITRIRIDKNVYTVEHIHPAMGNPFWRLTKKFTGPPDTNLKYELELAPVILPNQEPRQLPDGVIIDVDRSRLPPVRTLPDGSRVWEIMFSPRGTVIGPAAQRGHVHLLFRSLNDFTQRHSTLSHPDNESPELIVTITTQTGSVSTHSVVAGDIFRNAEIGVESE